MPGFTTHYLLGVKAYNDLPNNQLRRIISKYRWLYQLGLQGPDMFFYNIPILRHRDYRNVGNPVLSPCNITRFPSTMPSYRLIGGLPRKSATNGLHGSSYSS